MRHADLRERVCAANRGLVEAGLVVLSFGNASGIDRDAGIVAIKPSGVAYATLRPEDIVLVALEDGRVVDGDRHPSSDTPTHLVLYRSFPEIGGVVHTHSVHAAAWAQARREIPCLGTTHADHFHGTVPVTRVLFDAEIAADYERNTGLVIAERFARGGIDPTEVPACLDACHGPFTWGASPDEALDNAIALEHVAAMAIHTLVLAPEAGPIPRSLLDRHFRRKHGPGAYYGQPAEVRPSRRIDPTGRRVVGRAVGRPLRRARRLLCPPFLAGLERRDADGPQALPGGVVAERAGDARLVGRVGVQAQPRGELVLVLEVRSEHRRIVRVDGAADPGGDEHRQRVCLERGHGTGPEVRGGTDVQHGAAPDELTEEHGRLDGANAVAQPIGVQDLQASADRRLARHLAGVRNGAQATVADDAEGPGERLGRVERLQAAEPQPGHAAIPEIGRSVAIVPEPPAARGA